MPILPLAALVTVLLDGQPIQAYVRAYEAGGRIYAPVSPFLTRVAQRLDYEGGVLVLQRDGRSTRLRIDRVAPDALDQVYVAIAPVLRALGDNVRYDARRRTLEVFASQPREIATPVPFNANTPQVPPSVVFTPEPIATARPVWHGPAVPRRTPLPVVIPSKSPALVIPSAASASEQSRGTATNLRLRRLGSP